MKPYEPWEFCKSINCPALKHSETHVRIGLYCEDCKAYRFHQYLSVHNQILKPGSELEKVVAEAKKLVKIFRSMTDGDYVEFDLTELERSLSRLEEAK